MDRQLTSIQPGGGVVFCLELAWGRVRRWYLKTFRPGYVVRMRGKRRGERNGCPFEVLDPRDLKFYRNQEGYDWDVADDPFSWRDRLPFARVGLAELILIGGGAFAGAIVLAWLAGRAWMAPGLGAVCWILAVALAAVGGLVTWFFRDPTREVPTEPGVVVAPADGKVVEVDELAEAEFVDGPAIRIGIFLSIFDVHVNRMPVEARVVGLRYRKGKMLNALRPESARENEQLAVLIEGESPPHRRLIVRQITGAIARRIVCWLKPGDVVPAGAQFGMIKLGSRTELVLPREAGLEILVKNGDHVRAGSTVVARYAPARTGGGWPKGGAP